MKKLFYYVVFLLANFALLNYFSTNLIAAENIENIYLSAIKELENNNLTKAKSLLNQVIELDKNHAGAKLDLAILYCKLGEEYQSKLLLTELETKYLLNINIKKIIQKLRDYSCENNKNSQNSNENENIQNAFWWKLSAGYNTNMNQGATNPLFEANDGSQKITFLLADNYIAHGGNNINLNIGFMYKISDRNDRIFIKLNTTNYNHYTYFNTTTAQVLYQLPAFYLGEQNYYKLTSNIAYNVINLDAKPYLSQQQFSLNLTPNNNSGNSSSSSNSNSNFQTTFSFNFMRTDYKNINAYNSRIYELKTDLKYFQKDFLTTLSAGILLDTEENKRPGGNKKGFFIATNHKFTPNDKWLVELFAHYQKWNSSRIYLANFIHEKRKQQIYAYGINTDYKIDKYNSVGIEFLNLYNKENISLFQYKNKSIQFYWQYYFEK